MNDVQRSKAKLKAKNRAKNKADKKSRRLNRRKKQSGGVLAQVSDTATPPHILTQIQQIYIMIIKGDYNRDDLLYVLLLRQK